MLMKQLFSASGSLGLHLLHKKLTTVKQACPKSGPVRNNNKRSWKTESFWMIITFAINCVFCEFNQTFSC